MKANDILESSILYEGALFKLKKEIIVLPDLNRAEREIVEGRSAVAILALTERNKVLFVEQYRPAIRKNLLEIPAGIVEDNENPIEAAFRELEEETGYKAEKMEKLVEYYTSPGFSNTKVYLYRASDLKKTKQNLDEDEFLEVKEVDVKDIKDLKIEDGKTLFALKYL